MGGNAFENTNRLTEQEYQVSCIFIKLPLWTTFALNEYLFKGTLSTDKPYSIGFEFGVFSPAGSLG